jgi:hypothetical protein
MQILIALFVSVALQAPAAQPRSANAWQPLRTEIEHCLVDAKVARLEEVPIGVTKPSRAILQDSSCARAFAWKPLRPGMYSGYWESYKSEIAAYEMDKLLNLNMVPIAVERKISGISGAAILWLDGVRSWEQILPLPKPPAWPMRLVRMKMFDCLVGNTDRNKGNMLIDEDWNLYLIDHSRAFVNERRLPPASLFQNVDRALWERMLAIDEATLQRHLGEWLDDRQIRAMLQRRDAMKKHIDSLVAKQGEKVFFAP